MPVSLWFLDWWRSRRESICYAGVHARRLDYGPANHPRFLPRKNRRLDLAFESFSVSNRRFQSIAGFTRDLCREDLARPQFTTALIPGGLSSFSRLCAGALKWHGGLARGSRARCARIS